jgi:hypothetical protein
MANRTIRSTTVNKAAAGYTPKILRNLIPLTFLWTVYHLHRQRSYLSLVLLFKQTSSPMYPIFSYFLAYWIISTHCGLITDGYC